MQEDDSTIKKPRLGYRMVVGGLLLCGASMTLGLLLAIALHFFDDPDKPSNAFGYSFAVMLLLFLVGIASGVLGVLVLFFELRNDRPAVVVKSLPREEPGDEPIEEALSEPVVSEKMSDWDDAFSQTHRRR